MHAGGFGKTKLPAFGRQFFTPDSRFSRIGGGRIGGKAKGLVFAQELMKAGLNPEHFPSISVDIPSSLVVTTDVFDTFLAGNHLLDVALSDLPDERIGLAFQKASFPVQHVGDLRALIEDVRSPLAVRSSSLLEDALFRPFAGVYETKMIPNVQPDPNVRFEKLVEAIKFVYASTFSKAARSYLLVSGQTAKDEKMAVVIQEVVGVRQDTRFYPHLSGVARSFNFYPAGRCKPEEGVVSLALGLGKTIVDGGLCWTYSPQRPAAPPPFGSAGEIMDNTQLEFWAVHMGEPPPYDPIRETEYLVKNPIEKADYDGVLDHLASTYDSRSDSIVMGTATPGPRVLNFAPLLQLPDFPVNEVVKTLLRMCEEAAGTEVEIEFAVTLPRRREGKAHFAFLQVRPMVVSEEKVDVDEQEMREGNLLLASRRAMGNGCDQSIRDIVYVKPETFQAKSTRAIATELDRFNRTLVEEAKAYLLIGFGRWGCSDPWLGIPVVWGQIAGTRALVETTLPQMNVELSQGSHFFHNLSSFGVSYFSVSHDAEPGINWQWLARQPVVTETEYVRHVRLNEPLAVKVDGRSGRGVIRYPG